VEFFMSKTDLPKIASIPTFTSTPPCAHQEQTWIDPLGGRIVIPHLEPANDGGFVPALPSVATRKIALRSKASKRGALVTYFGERRAVVFESHLELMTALMLIRIPGVVDLVDQPPAVIYVDYDGVVHRHTFDYLVAFADGRRWAVAVKPYERAVKKNLVSTLGLIATQNPAFADQFHLVTEKNFSRTQVSNALLMHHISYEVDQQVDAIVGRLVASMSGTCTIADLVTAAGAGSRAYRSVVRFLARGTLSLKSGGHIRYSSIVGKAA
jgi:hypothetical protein